MKTPNGDSEMDRAKNLANREGGGVHFTAAEAVGQLVIVEGISSTFYYHLGLAGHETRSLCGVHTMSTRLPLETWAKTSHLNERWCRRCEVEQVRRQPAKP